MRTGLHGRCVAFGGHRRPCYTATRICTFSPLRQFVGGAVVVLGSDSGDEAWPGGTGLKQRITRFYGRESSGGKSQVSVTGGRASTCLRTRRRPQPQRIPVARLPPAVLRSRPRVMITPPRRVLRRVPLMTPCLIPGPVRRHSSPSLESPWSDSESLSFVQRVRGGLELAERSRTGRG